MLKFRLVVSVYRQCSDICCKGAQGDNVDSGRQFHVALANADLHAGGRVRDSEYVCVDGCR